MHWERGWQIKSSCIDLIYFYFYSVAAGMGNMSPNIFISNVLLKNPTEKKSIMRDLSWNSEKPSSRLEMLLKIRQNFIGKCLCCWSLFLEWSCRMEDCNFIKKRLHTGEFCEILKNNSFKETLWTTASGNDPGESLAFWGNSLQVVSFLTRCKYYIIFRDV